MMDKCVALSNFFFEEIYLLAGSFSNICTDVCHISSHSDYVRDGTIMFLFSNHREICIQHIRSAYNKRARIFVIQKEIFTIGMTSMFIDCLIIVVHDIKHFFEKCLIVLYGSLPAKKVAITGTNGKTSTSFFVSQILSFNSHKSILLGSLGCFVSQEKGFPVKSKVRLHLPLTTPALDDIYRAFHQDGDAIAILETSSHALTQKRIGNLTFSCGVFTNITQDHMDFHGSMDDYFNSKLILFLKHIEETGTACVWLDEDCSYTQLLLKKIKKKKMNVLTVGCTEKADLYVVNTIFSHERKLWSVVLDYKGSRSTYTTSICGLFQIYNICLAMLVCIAMGCNYHHVFSTFPLIRELPGRMNVLECGKGKKTRKFIVDYAHTPHALQVLLCEARRFSSSRIIVVFGCGGERDIGKRSIMGNIAHAYADYVIVTDDNYRSEDPASIRKQIISNKNFKEICHRYYAIMHAISVASFSDVIVIAGQGYDKYMCPILNRKVRDCELIYEVMSSYAVE